MIVRWIFKHLELILVACVVLLGAWKFEDLEHWWPDSDEPEQQVSVATRSSMAQSATVVAQEDPETSPTKGGDEDHNQTNTESPDLIQKGEIRSKAVNQEVSATVTLVAPVVPSDTSFAHIPENNEDTSRIANEDQLSEEPAQDNANKIQSPANIVDLPTTLQPRLLAIDVQIDNTIPVIAEISSEESSTTPTPKQTPDKSTLIDHPPQMMPVPPMLPVGMGGNVAPGVWLPNRTAYLPRLPTPLIGWIPPTPTPSLETREAITPEARRQSIQQIWVDARTAFWNRDLAVAEIKYNTLNVHLPDDPDILGELGNVYYVQGKRKQTTDAYYRAAELLIAADRLEQLNLIIDVIDQVEPQKASILRSKLSQVNASTPPKNLQ